MGLPLAGAEVPIRTERGILRTNPQFSNLSPAGPHALATDGGRIYAGAGNHDGFYSDAGGVFVFDAATSAQLFVWGDGALGNGDRFGESIALANGVLAVGAPRDDDAAQDAGAVYLLDASTGSRLARIINPETTTRSFDYFGQIVCLTSKWLAIAAPNDDDISNNSGAVHLYQAGADKSTWTYRHKFVPNAGTASLSHSFGASISILNDLVFIGDPADSTSATGVGVVYVFDAVTRSLRQNILPPTPRYAMAFGSSLAANDRVLAIGAENDPGVAYAGGSVSLFDPVSFAFRMEVHPPGLANGDYFGTALALRDGVLAISSPGENNPAGSYTAGAVYLADATDGTLFLRCRSGTGEGDPIIGSSIALAPDLLVAGAPDHDSSLNGSGSVFTFDPTRPSTPPQVTHVRAAQIPGTHQVRITYDLAASGPCTVGVRASLDGGGTWPITLAAADFTGAPKDIGPGVTPGTGKTLTLNAAAVTDLAHQFTKNLRFKLVAADGGSGVDSLVGCFSDLTSASPSTLDNYAPSLIARMARNSYGYGFSDSALATSVVNFRTKLAANINTYIVSKYLPSDVGLSEIDLSSTPAARLKSDGVSPNTSGYYYFSGPGIVRLAGTAAITSPRVILADGCDIYISGDLSITGISGGGSLVIISRRVSGVGGNIHIHPQVSRIDATLVAEGALQNGTLTDGRIARHDWVADAALLGQPLQIRGTLHSFNHRGGSLKPNPAGTGLVAADLLADSRYFPPNTSTPALPPDLETSRAQDLERFRVHATPPPDNQATLRVQGIRPSPTVPILSGSI